MEDVDYCLEIWLQTHQFDGACFIGLPPQLLYNPNCFFVHDLHYNGPPLSKSFKSSALALRQAVIRHDIDIVSNLLSCTSSHLIPVYGPNNMVGIFKISQGRFAAFGPAKQKFYNQELLEIGKAIMEFYGPKIDTKIQMTNRQAEVMSWVAQGKSNGEIAQILGVSPHTVDNFLRRTFVKVGVNNRVAAAVKCTILGLI